MKIKKFNLTIWVIVVLLSVFVAFAGMICAKITSQFLMCLLPLFYILSLTLSGAFLKLVDSSSPGFMIINWLYFVKCVVYPFISVVSGATYDAGNNDTIYAIILELGEVEVIYAVYYFFKKIICGQSDMCREYSLFQNHLNNGRFVTLCFLIFTLAVIIITPGALSNYNFFTVESLKIIYDGISEADTNGVVSLTIKVARYVFTAYFLGFCYRKYEQTKRLRYIAFAIAVVGVTMMIVRGVSRSDFVIPGVCGYFLLIRMFPQHKKKISVSLLGCLSIVFITFSLMRYGRTDSLADFSETLQTYFCCEKNMSKAIVARRTYGNNISYNTLLSDLFGNWAGIGGLFREHNSISDYFNFAYYGHKYSVDQIVPTIGQAYMQFGFFGTYVYTVIMVIVCLWLDKKYRQSEKIDFSYLYLYGSVKCGVALMGNLKIFSATVFNVLFPMLFLFWLNSKIIVAGEKVRL